MYQKNPVGRPKSYRHIRFSPDTTYFKPAGVRRQLLEEISLTIDEVEAIRLADLGGLYQEDAAKKLNVSRQTFGRIINHAHKKIADALVNGKAISISGGTVVHIRKRFFTCYDCNSQWEVQTKSTIPEICPDCGNSRIHRRRMRGNSQRI